MHIGKLWTAGVAVLLGVILSACYEDNENKSNSNGTPSTNSVVAPASITNRIFTLQFSSSSNQIQNLSLLSSGNYVESPVATSGVQVSGTYSPPLLAGNTWTTTLTMVSSNGLSTNLVGPQVLALNFTSSSGGTFTLSGGGPATASGAFSSVSLGTALNSPSLPLNEAILPRFALRVVKPAFRPGAGLVVTPWMARSSGA